ncbi:ABC transporter substrate-binding protein [Desulfatiglans anilini]|uniref:ABC transporter substrate-binding protein n=1 Tax=Desulfatiglans anilini TaxID=90728 RepID=UPI0004223064|nr:ABC transporter substrate-binding protein [Desulfatiglans anilini]
MKKFSMFISMFLVIAYLIFTVGFANATEPIVLAWPTTLDFPEGYQGRDAAIMATEEINSQGGVNVGGEKRLLKIEAINTRGALPGVPVNDALMAYKQIITSKQPTFIVGGAYRSEVLLAAMDYVSEKKLIHISSYAMTPVYNSKILENYDKYKYFFRVQATAIDFAKLYPQVLESLSSQHGLKSAHLVVEDANWSVATGKFVEKWLNENNWEVTGFDKFPIGATDYSSALNKIKKNKADVLVYAFSTPQSAMLMKQWHTMKVPCLPVGYLGATVGQKAWEAYDGKLEYVVSIPMAIGHIPIKAWPKSVEFYDSYKKRWGYGIEGGNCVSTSYDAVYVVADAINRANSLDTEKLIKTLEETDITGAIGRIRFGKDHNVIFGVDPQIAAIGCAFQWIAPGKMVPVFPASISEMNIVLPPWFKEK